MQMVASEYADHQLKSRSKSCLHRPASVFHAAWSCSRIGPQLRQADNMLQQRTLDPLPVRKTHRNATSKPMRSSRAFWAIVITVVIVIGLIISWYAGVRNQFYPDNFGVVEPGKIYRSTRFPGGYFARHCSTTIFR